MSWPINVITKNVLKFHTFLLLFSNKMLVIRTGIQKMFVRIENRQDMGEKIQNFQNPELLKLAVCLQNNNEIVYMINCLLDQQ